MGFLKNAQGSIISDYFNPVADIGPIKSGIMTEVALYEDHLEMKNVVVKDPVTLRYDQITDVYYGLQTEVTEKNKSVIGRAIAGAVSGTGTKKKTTKKFILIVSYISAAGEEGFLQFEDTRLYKGPKLSLKLRELCKLNEPIDKQAPSGPVAL